MSYSYCRECRKVYACTCGECEECKSANECYMKDKMWKVQRMTFREDNHESLCPDCAKIWGDL